MAGYNDFMILVENLSKTVPSGNERLTILHPLELKVSAGETCAILGPSGSGKSTLLALMAGLDQPTTGRVRIKDTDLYSLTENQRALFRREHIGFVFQNFQLIPTLNALENTMLPLELQGKKNARERAAEQLHKVGLAERERHLPSQLSGGEQQRVALARAFVTEPDILFADEPTGSLDHDNGRRILDLMLALNDRQKTTLVVVTHDNRIAERMTRRIHLLDGRITEP